MDILPVKSLALEVSNASLGPVALMGEAGEMKNLLSSKDLLQEMR